MNEGVGWVYDNSGRECGFAMMGPRQHRLSWLRASIVGSRGPLRLLGLWQSGKNYKEQMERFHRCFRILGRVLRNESSKGFSMHSWLSNCSVAAVKVLFGGHQGRGF